MTVKIKPIASKRWGDPKFRASAKASDGEPLKYTSSGACTVDGSSGQVRIDAAGSCRITATTTASVPKVSASTTFKINPAHPVITFGDQRTAFRRVLEYGLDASVSPSIPLRFDVVRNAPGTSNDEFCAVKNGTLVWTRPPTSDRHPAMPADCMVRVSAAKTSKNYVAPRSVAALVHIDYPTWNVHGNDKTVRLSEIGQSGGTHHATVTVSETTGDTLGMLLYVKDSPALVCDIAGGGPATATGTKKFTFDVLVTGTGVCRLNAQAVPQDWDSNGSKGKSTDNFTLTVKP